MLPRLFGNTTTNPVKNGTIEQNGCGKLNDITPLVLRRIRELGATHIWYTGLLEHATQTDYSAFGIHRDHTAIVKGRAGSPYAIKDYYDIDPDLASTPMKRMKEFDDLVVRTHKAGLKFIMDFVPNHVARQYVSDQKPKGVRDLGEDDNPLQAFSNQNNFYYIPDSKLCCQFNMQGVEAEPYQEYPAKATGNDCFHAHPTINDWYETVKLNYGIDYAGGGQRRFYPQPDTWKKMLDILLFWSAKGVDAFRCDMAEMVPVEFWNWALAKVKQTYPDVQFIAEVYNPSLYREYLMRGGFDFLYDKVGLYDTLRDVTCSRRPASAITDCWKNIGDIQERMLNFLENHDEQRLASDFFASKATKGKAALLVSVCMNTNPFMLYFGQELGERGMDNEGFSGLDGRTTIFDYWSIQSINQWRGKGDYALKNMDKPTQEIYSYYKKILHLAKNEKAINSGKFFDVMYANYENPDFNSDKIFAFIRQKDNEIIFALSNFSNKEEHVRTTLPRHAFDFLGIPEGEFLATELLSGKKQPIRLKANEKITTDLPAYSGIMLKVTY